MKFQFKEYLVHVFVLMTFAVIPLLYFYPILSGKDIKQGDTIHASGMAKELVDYKAETGKIGKWTNSMFGGMPAYQIMGDPGFNIFYYLFRAIQFGLPHFTVAIIFIYLLGFYLLLLSLNFKPLFSLIGSFAFAFASYNLIIIEAGHITKAYAIGFIPLVIAGILMVLNRNFIVGTIVTALALGLEIAANHLQITYYLFLMILVMMLVYFGYAIYEKKIVDFIKRCAWLLFALGLAIAPNLSNLWTTYEYGKVTLRGESELASKTTEEPKSSGLDKDYAFSWSYGKMETFTVLVPGFMGGSSDEELSESSTLCNELKEKGVPNAKKVVQNVPLYWGDQPFTSGPVYFGAIICFLFVLGLFILKGPERIWLLIAALFSFMLSWGKNFLPLNDLFFYNFPLYNKFRAVSMILVIANFAFVLMALLSLKRIDEFKANEKGSLLKSLKITLLIVGGILLFFIVAGSSFFNFSSVGDEQLLSHGYPQWFIDAIINQRKSTLVNDSLRSLFFVVLAAVVIWLYLSNKIKSIYLYGIMAILMCIDLIPVGKRYLNERDFVPKKETTTAFRPTEANQEILKDKDPDFRVLNLTVDPFSDVSTSYFHKSIGGYHGAKLRRYQELYDHHIKKNNFQVLNMLNTKYFIVQAKSGEVMAQRNPNALGNAWFVNNYKLVENPDSEINALTNFDPSAVAIVDKRYSNLVEKDNVQHVSDSLSAGQDNIKLIKYTPDELQYNYTCSSSRLAVFSEIYYEKGWNAYVDGKLTPHFCANYVLRSMVVPAGTHTLEFKFEPTSFYMGQKIALAGSLIIILMALGASFFYYRKSYR